MCRVEWEYECGSELAEGEIPRRYAGLLRSSAMGNNACLTGMLSWSKDVW